MHRTLPLSLKCLGVAVRTPFSASFVLQAHVKLFSFSLSLLIICEFKVWVLENQVPEEQM